MGKTKTAGRKILQKIILVILAVILLSSAAIVGMCLFIERPAMQSSAAYQLAYADTVIRISDEGNAEIFPQEDDISPETGIIFYVGAQIKPGAYIPLLARLAEQGYACFIPELTFNTALLESEAAEEIIAAHPEIRSWVLAGHSLGGWTASCFVDDHRDEVDGLIYIAAYSGRDLSGSDIPTLSVLGDTDGVLNRGRYEKRMAWNSADFEEYIIPGANHAQYGDYGKQPRDNDAVITAEAQQAQTAEIILDWMARHDMPGGSAA